MKKAYLFDVEVFPNVFMVTFREVKSREDTSFWIFNIEGKKRNDSLELSRFIVNNLLIGFNNRHYDNSILNFIHKNARRFQDSEPDQVTSFIYQVSNKVIKEKLKDHKYKLPFRSCDLMAVGTIKQSLKHVGVLLKHEWLQELPYPFDQKITTFEQLKVIKEYNIRGDIAITEKLYHRLRDKVIDRIEIEKEEGVSALDSTDSGISNQLTIKMYQEITGLDRSSFINLRTYRNYVRLGDCISPIIQFRSKELKKFLNDIKNVEVNPRQKGDFFRTVTIGKTTYTIGKGGLHDAMKNTVRIKKPGYLIRDADVGSYYPRIIEHFDCFPEHFDGRVKSRYGKLTDLRLSIKKTQPTKAGILKIVLNSFYGKYGSDSFFLYDPKAMYSVTLNGQLSLLMLIEELEHNGIEIFTANTDGITAYLKEDQVETYHKICKDWMEYTKLELEFMDYDEIYMKDCNNYFVIKDRTIIKEKGFFFTKFDPAKSFSMPIVPIAIKKYFLEKIPVRQTIEEHQDILDFTICENSDKKFWYEYRYVHEKEFKEKKFPHMLRFYASKGGGLLIKTDGSINAQTDKRSETSMIAKQNVTLINDIENPYPKENPIDFDYYVKEAMKVIKLLTGYAKPKKRNSQPENQLKLL